MRFSISLLLLIFYSKAFSLIISIDFDEKIIENSISKLAVEDATDLLRQACHCNVAWNSSNADVRVVLPQIDPSASAELTEFEREKNYPVLHYPQQDYSWKSSRRNDEVILELEAKTFNAVGFGVYGLLQEKLQFSFFHPREMVIPRWDEWPLPETFEWKAIPRFHKMGFHLHTQHPLELAEDLMNPSTDAARGRIKEYIDWLARNGQNYFEWNLLESIDLNRWPDDIAPVVEYGHQRGILMGIDLSLHMIQQKAFMLYKSLPASFRTNKKQIDRNLKKLCAVPWDAFDIEFSMTEFTKGNERKKRRLQLHLTDRLVNKYNVKPMGRMHVVQSDEMLDSGKKQYQMTAADSALDKHRGILIHTVMFYSIVDEKAPVYHNENLQHMLHALLEQQQIRETWYYPESAYWITFDNSVPMFLMSYLSARLDDILLCDSLDVTGHITFSSGWEWGYWLFDWSIARWSWKFEENGKEQDVYPTQFLSDIFNSTDADTFFSEALRLQEYYIKKDKELIRYMTAMTVTDELPRPMNLQLHPRPQMLYSNIRKSAGRGYFNELEKDAIVPLMEFASKTDSLLTHAHTWRFYQAKKWNPLQQKIFDELYDGIKITSQRAWFRASILTAISSMRLQEIDGVKNPNAAAVLDQAEKIRIESLEIVQRRENNYRYPVELLAHKRYSHTAYNYGYLFPVHELHFWNREIQQIKKDKWGPFFMSIWDVKTIIGLVD